MIRAALAALALTWAPWASAGAQGLLLEIGGPFTLTDQTGAWRTQVEPQGRLQLVLFGYAACEDMCLVTLPFIARMTRALTAEGVGIVPVMITIDPETDTPEAMGPALAAHSPDFVGLTGSEAELAPVYEAFGVARELLFTDPEGRRVYSHSGPLYLLGPEGRFLTILPPILPEAQYLAILRGYAGGPG
jgi:protein SCO1/2